MSSASIGPRDRSGTPSTACPRGRQVQRKIGPAWADRGRSAAGYFTKRTAEAWRRTLSVNLSARTKNKLLIELHGIFRRAQVMYGLEANPLSLVEKHPLTASGDIQVFLPEEVWALVRAASPELDAAIFW